MPEPLLPVAIVAKTRSDEDALAKSLSGLVAGDPTLRLERNPETHQLVLWCMGEAHADGVLDRLRAGGVELSTEPVRVALRETFAGTAKGHGRHVKQSGGHRHDAVGGSEGEPLPRASGVELVGEVMRGLAGRGGRAQGPEHDRGVTEKPLGHAEAPATDRTRSLVELRARTRGSGTSTGPSPRCEPMPSHLADQVKKEHAA